MMMLSDEDIRAELFYEGGIAIEVFDPDKLQPCSYDLRLGPTLLVPKLTGEPIDPADPPSDAHLDFDLGFGAYELEPGGFVLGATFESVTLSDRIAARIEGRSSLGRLGLLAHATAGFVDAGWDGVLTLELANVGPSPILLRAGMDIAQLAFFRLETPTSTPYGGRYQGAVGVQATKLPT